MKSKLIPFLVLGLLRTAGAEPDPRPVPFRTARFFITPSDSGPRVHADSLCLQASLVRFRRLPESRRSVLQLSAVAAIRRAGAEETARAAAAAGVAMALAMGVAYLVDPTGDSPNETIRGYRTLYYVSAGVVLVPFAYWVG